MASYSEDLFRDHFHSRADMITDMRSKQADVRKYDTGTIYCIDTADESRLFSSRFSYNKGACMLNMLRFVTNNDNLFFQVYKTYQQEFKGRNGTIIDFRNSVKSVLGTIVNGINIDTFFNQWAFRDGFPVYAASWNQAGNEVLIQLNQAPTAPASVSFFKMPIEIRLHSATGDTTIRVVNDNQDQFFHLNWSKTLSLIDIDPNSWLLDSVSSIVHDSKLYVGSMQVQEVRIYPNPSSAGWTVENLSANNTLCLTDVTGRALWQSAGTGASAKVPGTGLAAGLYILQISGAGGERMSYKLIKE